MVEVDYQTIILAQFSGSVATYSNEMQLALQAVAVLTGGILLWRLSALYHKKKINERKRNQHFQTPFSKGWKRK